MDNKEALKSDSTKKNFSFQFIYQIIILGIPLVISPYLTRTLGKTPIGDYTYTYSVMCYFATFANLGISKHGQRIISQRRDDYLLLRKTFWSLFFTHVVVSLICTIAYYLFVIIWHNDDKTLYLIHVLVMASTIFDITWFYYGIEKFKGVVIKNLIIKIVELVLIFVFVKTPDDIYIYSIIMGGSVLFGMLILLPTAIKYVKPIRFSFLDIKEHIKPLLVLFIAVLASSIYSIFDKTLLGVITKNNDNVTYYEYANRIILVPRAVAIVICTIMYPRVCVLIKTGNEEAHRKYFIISLIFVNFIVFGSVFGLLAIARNFAILYYGESFETCGYVMMALTPTIITVSIAEVFRMEYLIPLHKDKEYVICQVIAALLNIALSTVLIIYMGLFGAVIGTVISELFVMIFQIFLCRKYFSFKTFIVNTIPFLISGLIMYAVCYVISLKVSNVYWQLIIQVVLGFVIYTVLCAAYYFFISKEKNDLINILKRRR